MAMQHESINEHTLQKRGEIYLNLCDQMLTEMQSVFIGLDENPVLYRSAIVKDLPSWLQTIGARQLSVDSIGIEHAL